MRLFVGLCLATAATAVAAPQKENLPIGAVARLATVAPGAADPQRDGINALFFVNDKTLFVGAESGWTTWDLEKRAQRQAKPVGGPTFAVARDGDRLFVGCARKVHCIEPVQSATMEPARTWDSEAEHVTVLAFAPGGHRLVASAGTQKLTVLDTQTGKSTGTVELASRPVAATLAANGRILAVVTADGATRVYSLAANGDLEPLWTKRVARSDRAAMTFSPDGRLLAISSAGRVQLLDSVNGRPLAGLERRFGEGDVRAVAFSTDGRLVATGSGGPEPVLRLWQVDTGLDLGSYTGHAGDVNALAWSPDGKTLASAGTDATVLLWSAPTAKGSPMTMSLAEAWDQLDALDTAVAYAAVGSLLSDPSGSVKVIRAGIRGMADEQARVRRWIAELDHDEFRTREAARRSLLKIGLRAAAPLIDPGRKKLGPEGEQRVRLILEALDARGLHTPESGLFGEPLRSVRGVRVLESIGGKEARAVLEEVAKGPAEAKLRMEARAALETLPADK